MPTLLSLLRRSSFFLLPYGVFLALVGIPLAMYSKEEIHRTINHWYGPAGDFLMPWITLAADGITVTVLVLLLFAWNRRFAFFTGIACLLASGITQLLKHTLYYGEPRPKLFFEHLNPIRLVPGIDNDVYDTFPSGHTTLAFAFFFCLVFAVRNNALKSVFFLLAVLVAYSRVYLSEHFLSDVYSGSIIGTVTSLLVFWLAVNRKWMTLP